MQDFYTMESELESHSNYIYKKMKELTAKHKESDSSEELVTVLFQGDALLKKCRDHLLMTVETNFSDDRDRVISEREAVLADARALIQSMDEFDEKFLKYNVPRRGDSKTFEEYEERLREFMTIWKKEAKKGRERGERSLIERLQELGEERESTFEAVKSVAIDLGIKISQLLDECLWLLAVLNERETVMRSLEEVETVLGCLTVEGESIFADRFLAVVKFTKVAMSLEAVRECFWKTAKVVDQRCDDSEEKEVLRLILREVLRLEVAFRCPDLPMRLTDEVLFSMGNHLREKFEKRLSRVDSKMDELIAQKKLFLNARDVDRMGHLAELVVLRINRIWKKLELHQGARSC